MQLFIYIHSLISEKSNDFGSAPSLGSRRGGGRIGGEGQKIGYAKRIQRTPQVDFTQSIRHENALPRNAYLERDKEKTIQLEDATTLSCYFCLLGCFAINFRRIRSLETFLATFLRNTKRTSERLSKVSCFKNTRVFPMAQPGDPPSLNVNARSSFCMSCCARSFVFSNCFSNYWLIFGKL